MVSIIVVSYNTREMTLECLRSIVRETPDLAYEVLFIDNGSADGSLAAVEEAFGSDPRVRVISNEENLGFAQGNNVASRIARGRYLLLLNPDTVILDQAIERLVEFAEDSPQPGIWGGRTLDGHGELNPNSVSARYRLRWILAGSLYLHRVFPRSQLLNGRFYPRWNRDSIREVDVVSGCFLLINRSLWDDLGGFDPEFFMFGEEVDLCVRAAASGVNPLFTPAATIVHFEGASTDSDGAKISRLLGGEVRLVRKHWSKLNCSVAKFFWKSGIFLRMLTEKVSGTQGRWSVVWSTRRDWLAGNSPRPQAMTRPDHAK